MHANDKLKRKQPFLVNTARTLSKVEILDTIQGFANFDFG